MSEKCVPWTKAVRNSLVAAAIILALPLPAAAQSSDPSTLPLVTAEGIQYKGAFRLPAQPANGDHFQIGGRPMAFNPVANSLFIGSRAGRVAEVAIPALGNSADPTALPFASYLQPFSDPTEGRLSQVAGDGVAIDGLLIMNNRLYGTASVYYDAMNTQRVSHYSHSLQLDQSSFAGWSSVWDPTRTGFVSGAMAAVPAEWQSRLGGPAITGQCCIPIVTRTSWGPAAFAFDPAQIGKTATVPAEPLLYYTGAHPTLGSWESSNATYGMTTAVGGVAIISGTRTVLYFGRNGVGPACYGNATGDKSLVGKPDSEGGHYCYDPTDNSKGTHAYPYRYQVWAYDLNEFVAVREGRKQPWEVTPYGVWPLNFPTPEATISLGGVGYDAARQIIYVSQMLADRDGYEYRPIIHAFDLHAATSAGPATAVTIEADKAAPQPSNAAITLTATAGGGHAPLQYRWAIHDGTAWTEASAWGTSNRFTWTPASPNQNYRVAVGVRGAANTSDIAEVSAWVPYPIAAPAGGGPATGAIISSISLAVNRNAPQLTGTPITFTAVATGGVVPYQYKFLVYDGLAWVAATGWSELNAFTWTPSTANPDYRVGVWARSGGNTRDEPEASASSPFAITAPAPVLVTAVTIAANKTAPQISGTTVTWTATATGGVAPLQYKWLVYDDSWKVATGWSTSNTFTWTPAAANADYQVGVWVRGANNTDAELEVSTSTAFPITAAAAPAPVSSVVVGVNKLAPQTVGTTVLATATVIGGVGPYTYKWFISDADGWQAVTDWTASSTYAWTPTKAEPNYQIGVWVRSAGNTNDTLEASGTLLYPIK